MGILRALCGERRDICGKPKTILRASANFLVQEILCATSMKPNLLSAPSTFLRLTGLRCTSLRWSLLRLNLSLRIFRSLRRRATASIRFAAIIVEKLESGEAAVKRQHHLASFDLTDLPSVDVVADLCAQDFLVRPGANDGAGALPSITTPKRTRSGGGGGGAGGAGACTTGGGGGAGDDDSAKRADDRVSLTAGQGLRRNGIGERSGGPFLLFGPRGGAERRGRQ